MTAREPKFIYFLQPVGGGLVRVGSSDNPESRLEAIQSWSPVRIELIASTPGGKFGEAYLLQKFAPYRSHGDWFFPVNPVWSVVDEIRRTGRCASLIVEPDLPGCGDYINKLAHVRRTMLGMTRNELAVAIGRTYAAITTAETMPYIGVPNVVRCIILGERLGIRITAADCFALRPSNVTHQPAESVAA